MLYIVYYIYIYMYIIYIYVYIYIYVCQIKNLNGLILKYDIHCRKYSKMQRAGRDKSKPSKTNALHLTMRLEWTAA